MSQALPVFDDELIRLTVVVSRCEMRNASNWKWRILTEGTPQRLFVQIEAPFAFDNVTGERAGWTGRKWFISPHMTDSEIVQTLFKAALTATKHELREQFLYRGAAIFDPHLDLDALVLFRKSHRLSERPPHHVERPPE